MSGGHFDYIQFRMEEACDQLEKLLNDDYPEEVKKKFIEGLDVMRKAKIYLHRIDYYVSGDDSEESFFERLEDEISQYHQR